MQWKDIVRGGKVYHTLFTHWGEGVVERIDGINFFEALCERGKRRVVVKFEFFDNSTRLQNTALRKTPNKKKIREMVASYKKRGVEAVDGGHILILPEKKQ